MLQGVALETQAASRQRLQTPRVDTRCSNDISTNELFGPLNIVERHTELSHRRCVRHTLPVTSSTHGKVCSASRFVFDGIHSAAWACRRFSSCCCSSCRRRVVSCTARCTRAMRDAARIPSKIVAGNITTVPMRNRCPRGLDRTAENRSGDGIDRPATEMSSPNANASKVRAADNVTTAPTRQATIRCRLVRG